MNGGNQHIDNVNNGRELSPLHRRMIGEFPDPAAIADRKHRLVYMNPPCAGLFGMNNDDNAAHDLRSRWGDAVYGTIVKPQLDRCLAGEIIRHADVFQPPGSDPMLLEALYIPLPGRDGVVHHVVIMLRQIADYSGYRETSENSERTQSLVEIAGKINHDINNPLFAITGYLELLLQIETDDKKIEFINSALKNARQVGEVARRLSDAVAMAESRSGGGSGFSGDPGKQSSRSETGTADPHGEDD